MSSEADKAMKQAKAPTAGRNRMKQGFSALGASANQARSMVRDGTLTRAQIDSLLGAARTASGFVGRLSMAPIGTNAWSSIDRDAAALARAFGATW